MTTESPTPPSPKTTTPSPGRTRAVFSTEFAKFAKADLITRLLDVLDGYDRALASVPEDLKSQPWVEGMWLVERKLRQILEAEGLEPIDSLGTTVAWANVPRPRYGRTSVASPRRSRVEPSGNRLVRAALPEHSHCRPA